MTSLTSLSLIPPQKSARDLVEALRNGDTVGEYLCANTPSYDEIIEGLEFIESQNGTSWKQFLIDGCAMHEIPTRELLKFIGFMSDLLDIEEIIEFESAHGLFSYLLSKYCPSKIPIMAIDSKPGVYNTTYRSVTERSIPDQMLRLSSAKARKQLQRIMAIHVWPTAEHEASIRSLIQKEVIAAFIVIGEPSGGCCLSTNFDDFAKNKNYRKFQLPLRQVCFLDTRRYATQTKSDQSRSQVTMYLHNLIFPGFSEAGFIESIGEESFLKNYPPPLTDNLVLQDYVIDKRIPAWIAKLSGSELSRAIEIVTDVMKTPAIFDGCIILTIENMDQLEYWYQQRIKLQYPSINPNLFVEWYTMHINLAEKGLIHYRNAYNMPQHVKKMKNAEEWLWVKYSQRNAPPSWDVSALSLRTRFKQLWDDQVTEQSIKTLAHNSPAS